jgi:hypothetical protein
MQVLKNILPGAVLREYSSPLAPVDTACLAPAPPSRACTRCLLHFRDEPPVIHRFVRIGR